MRAALNALYRASGLAAGFFLVMIAVMSLTQIVGRLLGYAVHSFDEFAGWFMAASMFLGLAFTLRANEHIRVTLVIARLGGAPRRAAEVACLAAATFLVGFFAWAVVDMTWTSYQLGDVSIGVLPIKLWLPQSSMALGLAILFVALLDDLLVVLFGGRPSYESAAAPVDATPGFER